MLSYKKVLDWQKGALGVKISRGDIVIISGAPRCVSNIFLLMKARIKGARTIWWGHLWTATTKPWRFYLRMVLMKLSHGLLFYTDQEIEEYKLGAGRSDGRPVSALNNGLDLTEIQQLRKPFDPSERNHRILFIGRLTEKSKCMQLVEVLADPKLSKVKLDIVGDGELKDEMNNRIQSLNLQDRIFLHGGTVDEEEIASIANKCAVFAYPGSVGLSLIHAMAYGLPAIVHDDRRQQMPEIAAFKNGVTGLTFKIDDVSSLASKILEILAEKETLKLLSLESAQRADVKYNTEAMAKRFVDMIERVQKFEEQ
ncbi:MAG: glycosyltransferase family 4 protein [Parasphingorhabdus sp.]